MDRREVGASGEEYAEAYLHNLGYTIRDRNWRCRRGEIDIIAEMEGILVFVEVRSRSTEGRYGTAQESVNRRKQQKVRGIAEYYVHQYRKYEETIRFDVISILFNHGGEPVLEHIKGAF
ncbi:YraN family protein [Paenibacillus eucommiae]|uniref:UPF0102 protein J2Z66_002963 n=1 Tax=Paenibacillus eucommiae TaxID=1355755 RepID=A0ABS4IUT7_9BACL|nr:YraN family protein [Paenibacillus eucommiae]MBP1991356.1 putative endonuclease [Paenibacillus eucommiae]